MKKLLLLILMAGMLFSNTFDPTKHNQDWNFLFSLYEKTGTNGAGIVPENVATPKFTMSEEILSTFLYSLPESTNATIAHPEYFPSDEPEIVINETAEAFVTFYSEGAGYRNTLGYYTYEGNTGRQKPQSREELQKNGVIIFPNASLKYSNGELYYGLSVSLGKLSAGTKVIFFIISNGWRGNSVRLRDTNWIFSTYSALNLEYDENSTKTVPDDRHVALLWNNVGEGNILLMGFEDILRTHNGCDNDFNDVLFSFSTNPMEALTETNGSFAVAPTQTDSDNDGVSDAFDAFDDDNERAYIVHYPEENDSATLLFEDMWPKEGDYDMNDLSLELHVKEIKDSAYKVKEIQFSSKIKSNGAAYKNGFAIQINTPSSNIESAQISINGMEYLTDVTSSDNDTTIITFFTDAVKEFKQMEDYYTFATTAHDEESCHDPYDRFINVCDNRPLVSSPEIDITIVLHTAATLSSPPYNPFLIVNNGVTLYNEIHLPNNMPTSLANTSIFNTYNDASDLNNNLTYKTRGDKPWGLLIPRSFAHPLERENISDAYIHYDEWVQSKGKKFSNWYVDDNIDSNNNLFAKPHKIHIKSK